MNDNVEWKDIKMKVPGVATTKFEHEFNYPNPQASLIDVKVANGTVVFKTWDQEDVKVEAKSNYMVKWQEIHQWKLS